MNFPETTGFLNFLNLLQFRDLKKEKKNHITLEAITGRFKCESQL